ncbi:hypothetical protein ANANG_G00168380, partial [Anguilla anguilla]
MPGEALQADSKAVAGSSGGGSLRRPAADPQQGARVLPAAGGRQPQTAERGGAAGGRQGQVRQEPGGDQRPPGAHQAAGHLLVPGPAPGPPPSPAHLQARGPAGPGAAPPSRPPTTTPARRTAVARQPQPGAAEEPAERREALPRATGRKRSSRSWAPQRSEPTELNRRSFAESLRVFPSHGHAHAQGANLNLERAGHARSRDPWLHVSHSSSDIRRICRRAAPAGRLRPLPAARAYAPP